MVVSMYQSGLGKLGDNISGIKDSTGTYCIFSIVDGGWRKNTIVSINSCVKGNAGYVPNSSTTWTDVSTWTPNVGYYYYENLTGCEAGNKYHYLNNILTWKQMPKIRVRFRKGRVSLFVTHRIEI